MRRIPKTSICTPGLLVLVVLTGCASATSVEQAVPTAAPESTVAPESTAAPETPATPAPDPGEQLFPDVVGVAADETAEGVWTFRVTLSSPYDTPERYADAWRVVGPDGVVYGERILGHDHANEQPFTRSESGIEIPAEVAFVTVEARDQANGWGGTTLDYQLPN